MNLSDRDKLRKSVSRVGTVTVGTTSGLFLSGNPNRIALTIIAPNTTRITLSPVNPVVLGSGLTLYAADPPWTIKLAEHAGLLFGALWAISDTGAQPVTYIETTLID